MTSGIGEANPNWRGGRSIASNGYVLVRVGVDHHLADVRGYAYEHRVVAEEKIGRRLEHGEVVHHIDHDKTNNTPGNLLVCTRAEHRAEHRSDGSLLQSPGEPNHVISCACGCGETFARYDSVGRPRRYVTGHSGRVLSREQLEILAHLQRGPAGSAELAMAVGRPREAISTTMQRLIERGEVSRVCRGRWQLVDSAGMQQDAGTEPDLLTVAWAAGQWEAGNLRDDDFIETIRAAMRRMEERR